MGIEVITAPSGEPITLAEAKAHLRVVSTAEDDLITALVMASRQHVESWTGRALLAQTWRLTMDDFPRQSALPIELPGGRATSVSVVKYVDSDGASQELTADTDYIVDLSGEAARLAPASGKQWPATRSQIAAVSVEFAVGYGAADKVPAPIKAAMKLIIGELYANRETWVDSRLTENATVDNLIFPYRLIRP